MSSVRGLLDEIVAIPRERYASVHRFELVDTNLQSGKLSGFAAPADGPKPCAVVLLSGTQTIAVARAIQFSTAASQRGVRRGWCGFAIGGMAQGLALGYDIKLRCLVSERVLGQWTAAELAKVLIMPARHFVSVADLRGRLQAEGGCTNYRQVLPFALELARSRGSRAVLEALYRYLLGRPLDNSVEVTDLFDTNALEAVWKRIIESDEFRARRVIGLPGPFDPGFPFPLDRIDAAMPSSS